MHGDAQPQRRPKKRDTRAHTIYLIVDCVSARSVRVVEPPVHKGPGFAYGDESFKRVHYVPRIMFRWYIKRNRRFVKCRQFPLRPAYPMMCNKPQGKAMEKGSSGPEVGRVWHGRLHVPVGHVEKWGSANCTSRCRNAVEIAYVTIVNVVERAAMEAAMPSHKAALLLANFPSVV